MVGFNCRLDTLQAVVLNAKLAHLDQWKLCETDCGKPLRSDARRCSRRGSTFQPGWERRRMAPLRCQGARARPCPHRPNAAGIPAAIHYPTPLHLTGAFADLNYGPGDFPVAEKAAREILSLPMHPHLSESQQERVVEALAAALG